MKKFIFFTILLPLAITLISSASAADQYSGGRGQGYAMGECTGRLDGIEIASSRPSATPRNDEVKSQYHGGLGDGYAMGEYVGPIDDSKKQPQGRKGGLHNILSKFFKGRNK